MVKIIASDEIAGTLRERVAALETQGEILMVEQHGRGPNVEQADAVVSWHGGRALGDIFGRAPKLRWVHSWSAGVESLPDDDLRRRGIILTNAAGVYAIPIAEWVLAAMLMVVKRAHEMHDAQHERRWASNLDLDELTGKTVLLLGTGGIGGEVARRAAAFEMRVWGASRGGAPVEHVERVVAGDEWKALLPEADFIVMTLPLTDQTRNMVGSEELARFKAGAWLINVGRGATVDEPALLDALQRNAIGGAAIDAWATEPLPADHPAWSLPNIIVWPHHSGSSPKNTDRGLDLLVDNIGRFAAGRDLRNVVDLDAGY